MIKAVIFDLNGVFIKSPKLSERFEKDFGIAENEFMPALKDVMSNLRMPGAKEFFSYWEPYLNKWSIKFTSEKFADYWFGSESLDPKMIALAKDLEVKGLKLFILSNNLRERSIYYEERFFPLFEDCFEKMYFSWQTGFIKPDVRAYELLLKENGLSPSECIYFDDSEKNIAVAESLGIKSYIFNGLKNTTEIIESNL